ncbi:MAG: LapA family protein [Micavibrio sp.]
MKDFTFTLFAWLITLPAIIGSILFAVYNNMRVELVLSPFRDAVTIPLYMPVLGAIAIGFLLGALMTWAANARGRHERRALLKQLRALEKQMQEEKQKRPAVLDPVTASSYPPISTIEGRG